MSGGWRAGAVNTSESVGGVVGSTTALRGTMMNPTVAMPPSWRASTCTGMFLPEDATAGGTGWSRVTVSACTFDRKMVIESVAELPAASNARPTILMRPPAPEFAGNVTSSANETVVTTDADEKIVSVVAI